MKLNTLEESKYNLNKQKIKQMLTLEKIMSELRVNSVNEIIGGSKGKTKTRTKTKTKTKKHTTHGPKHG